MCPHLRSLSAGAVTVLCTPPPVIYLYRLPDLLKLFFFSSSVLKYIIVTLANGILIPWGNENLDL